MVLIRVRLSDTRVMAAVFIAAFTLYFYTAARYVVLEDDALFIGALHFWGVSHPPGYPAHTLLGGIFYSLLPFGSPALKAHLFSGVAGAAACVALYAVVRQLGGERIIAVCAALAYAVSKSFWSQAVVAEVYTLNSFLFFTLLILCVACQRDDAVARRRRTWLMMGVIVGLGLAAHYPLFGLATVGLLPLVPFWRYPLNALIGMITAVLIAVFFYGWLLLRSQANPEYNFYGPISDYSDFLFYFLRQGYIGAYDQSGVSWEDKVEFFNFLAMETVWQYTPFGACLALVGACAMLASSVYRRVAVGLLLSFLAVSVMLVLLLDAHATLLGFAFFRVYPLTAYGIMAIFSAFGIVRVAAFVRTDRQLFISLAVFAAVIVLSLTQHWTENNRRNDRWAHDLAVLKMEIPRHGSILLLNSDFDLPLGYLHYVTGVRPDLEVYSDQGLIYKNRLYGPFLSSTAEADKTGEGNKAKVLRDFINNRYRQVYFNPQRREYYREIVPEFDIVGFWARVRKDSALAGKIIIPQAVRLWMSEALAAYDDIPHTWTRYQLYREIVPIAAELLINELLGKSRIPSNLRGFVEQAANKYPPVRILAYKHLLGDNQLSLSGRQAALEWVRNTDIERFEWVDDAIRGDFYFLHAALIAAMGGSAQRGEDNEVFAQALYYAPPESGDVVHLVRQYYELSDQECVFIAMLKNRYADFDELPQKWKFGMSSFNLQQNCQVESVNSGR